LASSVNDTVPSGDSQRYSCSACTGALAAPNAKIEDSNSVNFRDIIRPPNQGSLTWE